MEIHQGLYLEGAFQRMYLYHVLHVLFFEGKELNDTSKKKRLAHFELFSLISFIMPPICLSALPSLVSSSVYSRQAMIE